MTNHYLQGAAAEDDLEDEELEFSDDEKASVKPGSTSALAAKVVLCATTSMLSWGASGLFHPSVVNPAPRKCWYL